MWIRQCAITAAGNTWQTTPPPDDSLRMRFQVKFWTTNTEANTAIVKITNPNRDKANAIVKSAEHQPLTISGGYYDGQQGLLFSGEITQAVYGRENPTDTWLIFYAADINKGHRFGVTQKTLPQGSTPNDHVNAAVQAMQQVDSSVSLGYVDPALNMSTPSYPRAIPLFGPAREVLAKIAKSKGANAFYHNGVINILKHGNALPGSIVVLNTQTGLIGMPTQTANGIMVRCLINPAIVPGSQIQINQSDLQLAQAIAEDGNAAVINPTALPNTAADGIYNVLAIDLEGDTRGEPWYMDLTCWAPGSAAGTVTDQIGAWQTDSGAK